MSVADNTQVNTPATIDSPITEPDLTVARATPTGSAINFQMTNAPTKLALPEIAEYKDKEWFLNAQKADNPVAELYKQFENAQSLIGKKSEGITVPPPDATPEQVKAFHKALGVPDTADSYVYTPPTVADGADKDYWEYIDKNRDKAYYDSLKAVALEAGMTPAQYQKMMEGSEKAVISTQKDRIKAAKEEAETRTKVFDTTAVEAWGDKKEAVIANAKTLLPKFLSQKMQALVPNLSPEAWIVIADAFDGVNKQLIKPDTFSQVSSAKPVPVTAKAIQERGTELMMHPAYRDVMHPEHDKIKRQVDETFRLLKR